MGKTIGLKLTHKEERIVNQLNRGGITNSELLRDALWYYFKSLTSSVNHVDQEKVNVHPTDVVNSIIHEFESLENELSQLREQNNKFQQHVTDELTNLHNEVLQTTIDLELLKQNTDSDEIGVALDVNNEIDKIIKRRNHLKEVSRMIDTTIKTNFTE